MKIPLAAVSRLTEARPGSRWLELSVTFGSSAWTRTQAMKSMSLLLSDIDFIAWVLVHAELPNVTDNSNHLDPGRASVKRDTAAKGIFIPPIMPRGRAIDYEHGRRFLVIRVQKHASGDERNAQRLEIIR